MPLRHLIAAILLALSAPLSLADSPPETLEQALTAMLKQDYGVALNILRPMATRGHAEAQYYLGHLYRDGNGVERSDKLAHDWFVKAAAGGHATAGYQVRLIEIESRR